MKMLGKTLATVAVTLVTFVPVLTTPVFAASLPASEQQATQSLVKQLTGLRSFTANFEQTTRVSGKTVPQKRGLTSQHLNQTFTGIIKVERPGKFFWETTQPSKQSIITTGKTIWIYDPDLQQVVRQSVSDQVANTPALLLSGNTNTIMQAYKVTQPDQTKNYYTLVPKAKDTAFQDLTISFGAQGVPTLMILNDSLGQVTTVRFSDIVKNVTIPASIFNFIPPKGTDIIDQ